MEPQIEYDSYDIILVAGTALRPQYRNLVYSKWMRALRHGNDFFKLIDSASFFTAYKKYIDVILERPDTTIKLAVLSENHDVVLGFSVTEPGKLHWLYVHKDLRRQGIGRSLVPDGIHTVSHLTKMGMLLWNKLPSKFNPF